MKTNVLFPVAGDATRFGNAFKPFLNIGDITFIELTFEPFKKWRDEIDVVYFICTEDQENNHNVTSRLTELIDHDKVEVIKIKNKTTGPYQTLKEGIEMGGIAGPSIICDCDHSLNVDNIFKAAKDGGYDAIIPTWKICENEWANWSKIVLDKGVIKMICEKERIYSSDYEVKGIIGCIFFNEVKRQFLDDNFKFVSDALEDLLRHNKLLKVVGVDYAHFYGDKEMLENFVNFRRKQCSVFCDIDGVLVKHTPHSTCLHRDNLPLESREKLNYWRSQGHKIILTTARSEKYREEVGDLLKALNVSYDSMVMGLPAGPRILINDHKPSKTFTSQSNGIELFRDEGLASVDLDEYIKPNDIEIIKTFEGGSFAKTYLISNFVRKYIEKRGTEPHYHYKKLKRQMEDLIRFDFLWEGSAPRVIDSKDTDFSFYFDMEYLEGYKTLSACDGGEVEKALDVLFEGMDQKIYSLKKRIDGIFWIDRHYENKIFSKFSSYMENDNLKMLIDSDAVNINGTTYMGLRKILQLIDKHAIKPMHIRPVHGDFTFENILWNGNNIKFIDMDGADRFDAAELDLGKMCQSVFSRFNEWKNLDNIIHQINSNTITCNGDYFRLIEDPVCSGVIQKWMLILNEDYETIKRKGIFYMCLYFIRFVPFRMKLGEEHGVFALVMAIVWLSKILTQEK